MTFIQYDIDKLFEDLCSNDTKLVLGSSSRLGQLLRIDTSYKYISCIINIIHGVSLNELYQLDTKR